MSSWPPALAVIAARPLLPLYALVSVKPKFPFPDSCATARKNALGTGLVGSMTPGVLELETSTSSGAAA